MNQTQQGMTGTGGLPFTWVVVGSETQFVTQLTVSVGKTVVGNVPVGITTTGTVEEDVDEEDPVAGGDA